jgi:hypothetical protein
MTNIALPNPVAIFDEIVRSGAGLAGASGLFRRLERLRGLKKGL